MDDTTSIEFFGNAWNVVMVVFVVVFISFVTVSLLVYSEHTEKVEACEDIGLEGTKHYVIADIPTCKDEEGNRHYVELECDGHFWWMNCEAKIINVGGTYDN